MTIVPDAFFTLVLPDGTEQQVILEIDMGTLAQRRLRAKLRGYLLAVKGPIPVLFIVPGPSRQAQMARYAQEEAHADDHLLAACLGGKADYLVTGDADLLSLDRHPKPPNLQIIAKTISASSHYILHIPVPLSRIQLRRVVRQLLQVNLVSGTITQVLLHHPAPVDVYPIP